MALIDDLKKTYNVNVKCSNCGSNSTISVPKGTTKKEFMKDSRAKCGVCGCNTLELKEGMYEREVIDTPWSPFSKVSESPTKTKKGKRRNAKDIKW